MDKQKRLESLLTKIISEFEDLIKEYNKGHSEVNYSLIFEELQFMKFLTLDTCMSDSYFNSITEYFLTNDYKVRRIW